VGRTGNSIDAVALGEQRPVLATVALIRRGEAKRAEEVLEVIPAHEALNPSPRLVDDSEANATFAANRRLRARPSGASSARRSKANEESWRNIS